jgi:hypothetical protein
MARVGVEWINNFPAPCTQNTLSYCDETSVGFLNGMVSRGHTQAFNWGDANAWERDFRDPANGGDDTNWADDVDFVHFSSHGTTSAANVFSGSFGSKRDNCSWTSSRARLGNFNLEYLCIDACRSIELTRDPIATWHGAFHGLRMVLGFTDLVSDSWWTGGRGNSFGRSAGNGDRITGAWLDAGYSFWLDDNPVAMAAGRNQADAENRLGNERLGGGFGDIPNSQIGWYAWRWWS